MAKILLAHQDCFMGEDLKFLLEEKGHGVDWYQFRNQVKELYNNVPNYDVAIVDRCINGEPPSKDAMGIDCDDLVERLKQTYPDKKVICLTHRADLCERADKNIVSFDGEVILEKLCREIDSK